MGHRDCFYSRTYRRPKWNNFGSSTILEFTERALASLGILRAVCTDAIALVAFLKIVDKFIVKFVDLPVFSLLRTFE